MTALPTVYRYSILVRLDEGARDAALVRIRSRRKLGIFDQLCLARAAFEHGLGVCPGRTPFRASVSDGTHGRPTLGTLTVSL